MKAALAVGAGLGQRGLLQRRVSALYSCGGYVQGMIHSHLMGGGWSRAKVSTAAAMGA